MEIKLPANAQKRLAELREEQAAGGAIYSTLSPGATLSSLSSGARPVGVVMGSTIYQVSFRARWLVLWGITVSGDSPQFSTLTARNAPPQAVGSVLTLTNSIGFGISNVSILLFVWLAESVALGALLPWLAIGPALGLWALRPLLAEERAQA